METEVTVNVLPFNGNAPDGVTAVLLPVHAVTFEALWNREARGVTGCEMTSNINREREFLGLSCSNGDVQTRETDDALIDGIVLRDHLPVLNKIRAGDRVIRQDARLVDIDCETVTAPELLAVRSKFKTGTRAAPEPVWPGAVVIREPAPGLSDAKLTERPVAGAVTSSRTGCASRTSCARGSGCAVLMEFTNALVLGPKYPAAGEIPFAAWKAPTAFCVRAPK